MTSVWSDSVGLPIGESGAVITVGTFDGVHRGHYDVLVRLAALAADTGRPSVPFTPTLAAYEAEQFVDAVLRERFRVAELLVGHDHGFGRGRLGDIDVLKALGASRRFGVTVLPPVHSADGEAISSTAIRTAITRGDLQTAAAGLGRPYSLAGTVIRGDQRGRLLGYPTLNLQPPPVRKLLPPDGVYAVRVQTPQGPFGGMLNLGPRPTFGDASRRIETHDVRTPKLRG